MLKIWNGILFASMLFVSSVVLAAQVRPFEVKGITPSKNIVEVKVTPQPDKSEWRTGATITGEMPMIFRWRTGYENVGDVVWQVSSDRAATKILASGDARSSPNKNSGGFTVDFPTLFPNAKKEARQYFVRIVTYKKLPVQINQGGGKASLKLNKIKDKHTLHKASKKNHVAVKQTVGAPSKNIRVNFVPPGEVIPFHDHAFEPELLRSLDIEIRLDTLKIHGDGGDEDPYIFALAFFLDGTTVKPELVNERISFRHSNVRIRMGTKTHENLNVSNVDIGKTLSIPHNIGRFRETIRPIGFSVASQLGATEEDMLLLRENTFLGILVIGFEEDAVPSTEAVNSLRAELVENLRDEMNGLIRGVSVSGEDVNGNAQPASVEDMTDRLRQQLFTGVADIRKRVQSRMIDRALEDGMGEFWANSKFIGYHSIVVVPGALNADDFVGSRFEQFSYEDLLQSNSQGIPFTMQLNQNWDGLPRYLQADDPGSIWYEVKGRVRRR